MQMTCNQFNSIQTCSNDSIQTISTNLLQTHCQHNVHHTGHNTQLQTICNKQKQNQTHASNFPHDTATHFSEVQQLAAVSHVQQSQSCNVEANSDNLHKQTGTNMRYTTPLLSSNKTRKAFHKQQYDWKVKQCNICHETWPSRIIQPHSQNVYECLRCRRDKLNPKKFSKANNMHPGEVPESLQGLTQVEEMLIARISPIMYVYRKHGGQRGYKGHVLNLSQDIQSLLDTLPQNVSDLPILILRREGANESYSDFTVRKQKVLTALQWLKENNPFYKSIIIDHTMIDQLPENGVPDGLLQHHAPLEIAETVAVEELDESMQESIPHSDAYEFDAQMDYTDGCTCDSDENIEANHNSTSFISVPHQEQTELQAIRNTIQDTSQPLLWPAQSKTPLNEFTTEGLATMAFPTLFPHGTGDPTIKARKRAVSLTESFKHLICYGEIQENKAMGRFASHPRFMYWALNMKQRHHLLSQANVYLKQHPNDAALTLHELRSMIDKSTSEQLMSRLHKYVSKVQGTQQYWYQRSLELKTLIQTKGSPTFFFTVSAADTYWPELHTNIMPHNSVNPTHSMKINAVINNPHLTDWYFTQRFTDLTKQWLYNHLDAEWHWNRFEYQSRGSTHAHGCAKLKNDPGLCDLMKQAALAWKLQNKPQSELLESEQLIIDQGKAAEEIIISYVDWLTTTFNESIPAENWRMPTPQNHPCAQNPLQVSDINQDYADLVNTVERHTKCNAAYCLRRKKGQTQVKCRFDYPRPLQSNTGIEFEELPNKRIRAKVVTKRNDPLINSHNKSLLQFWRANVDVQTIVDIEDCVRYMTKYAAKAETKSQTAKQIFKTCVNKLTHTSQACNAVRSAMIKSIGERDFSAQETAHMLLGLPLYNCTYTFTTLILDDSKTTEIQHTSSGTSLSPKLSIVQFYSQRCQHGSNNDDRVMQMNLLTYSSHFYVHNNALKERKTEVIVRTYPSYSSNPRGKHYPQYCKYQLIKYKPWHGQISNVWNSLPDTDENYIAAYHEFISSPTAVHYLPQLEEELELVQQYLEYNNDDEFEDESGTSNEQDDQEEWMLLSQLNPTFQNTENESVDNVNWQPSVTSLTPEQLNDSANWISSIRKHYNTDHSFQHNAPIDTNTLNDEQRLAFEIITEHHQKLTTESELSNDHKQLLMIIYGTTGTGKSYLIHAIASQLQNDCCLTATTGIAAFNINGITIHSLLQLPIRNQGAKDLEGNALMRLQDRMKGKKYIIIDEMLMLGQRTFTWIDKRLRQATAKYDKPFGGMSIILIGDFAQLPPVGDKTLFSNPSIINNESNDHGYILYKQFQTVVQLKKILRQDSNTDGFRQLLLALRNGNITNEIWKTLLTRSPSRVINCQEFESATHLFFDKQSVAECNLKHLQKLGNPIAKIEAINSDYSAK